MTCALLKFELSVGVVLGPDVFPTNRQVDSVMLFI